MNFEQQKQRVLVQLALDQNRILDNHKLQKYPDLCNLCHMNDHITKQCEFSLVFYHGTTIKALQSIIQNGIHPHKGRLGNALYVSDDPQMCIRYVYHNSGKIYTPIIIKLKIMISGLIRKVKEPKELKQISQAQWKSRNIGAVRCPYYNLSQQKKLYQFAIYNPEYVLLEAWCPIQLKPVQFINNLVVDNNEYERRKAAKQKYLQQKKRKQKERIQGEKVQKQNKEKKQIQMIENESNKKRKLNQGQCEKMQQQKIDNKNNEIMKQEISLMRILNQQIEKYMKQGENKIHCQNKIRDDNMKQANRSYLNEINKQRNISEDHNIVKQTIEQDNENNKNGLQEEIDQSQNHNGIHHSLSKEKSLQSQIKSMKRSYQEMNTNQIKQIQELDNILDQNIRNQQQLCQQLCQAIYVFNEQQQVVFMKMIQQQNISMIKENQQNININNKQLKIAQNNQKIIQQSKITQQSKIIQQPNIIQEMSHQSDKNHINKQNDSQRKQQQRQLINQIKECFVVQDKCNMIIQPNLKNNLNTQKDINIIKEQNILKQYPIFLQNQLIQEQQKLIETPKKDDVNDMNQQAQQNQLPQLPEQNQQNINIDNEYQLIQF